jgi:hypothetical protein
MSRKKASKHPLRDSVPVCKIKYPLRADAKRQRLTPWGEEMATPNEEAVRTYQVLLQSRGRRDLFLIKGAYKTIQHGTQKSEKMIRDSEQFWAGTYDRRSSRKWVREDLTWSE